MKSNKNELNVDFIGGQVPLTASEQKALSEYFYRRNASKKQKVSASPKRTTKKVKKIQA